MTWIERTFEGRGVWRYKLANGLDVSLALDMGDFSIALVFPDGSMAHPSDTPLLAGMERLDFREVGPALEKLAAIRPHWLAALVPEDPPEGDGGPPYDAATATGMYDRD